MAKFSVKLNSSESVKAKVPAKTGSIKTKITPAPHARAQVADYDLNIATKVSNNINTIAKVASAPQKITERLVLLEYIDGGFF